jgi:hypothetical protein
MPARGVTRAESILDENSLFTSHQRSGRDPEDLTGCVNAEEERSATGQVGRGVVIDLARCLAQVRHGHRRPAIGGHSQDG